MTLKIVGHHKFKPLFLPSSLCSSHQLQNQCAPVQHVVATPLLAPLPPQPSPQEPLPATLRPLGPPEPHAPSAWFHRSGKWLWSARHLNRLQRHPSSFASSTSHCLTSRTSGPRSAPQKTSSTSPKEDRWWSSLSLFPKHALSIYLPDYFFQLMHQCAPVLTAFVCFSLWLQIWLFWSRGYFLLVHLTY